MCLHGITEMTGTEKKKQVCIRLKESTIKEMEKIKGQTGMPISKQVELKMKGYKICKE